MDKILQLINIDYKNVFKNLNLTFKKGGIYLILGDNGSGKTTLLYLLQGLYKPDSGKISFHNEVYQYNKRWLRYLRSKITLLFQNPDYQIIGLTVKDDIALGLKVNGVKKELIDEIIRTLLSEINLIHLQYRRTDQLSFGEKKKVSLAAISVLNPEIILLDEPYAGLDREGRVFVDNFIKRAKSEGKTVLITSHEPGSFMNLVDEIYFISNYTINKVDNINCDFLSVFQKNMLLLAKYGYFEKPLPESIFAGEAH